MRGSPFTFSTFALGLNVLDSPYMLKQGETRDVLNMVSTPKGSARKRYGSEVLASGTQGTFPGSIAVTDTFIRVAETPLKKDGKGNENAWETFGGFPNTGEITAAEEWSPKLGSGSEGSGALYNVKEETNPAVFVEISKLESTNFSLGIQAKKGATLEGYSLQVLGGGEITLFRFKSGSVTLGTFTGVPIVGDRYGLGVRGGIVTAYRRRLGVWKAIIEVADSSFASGFGTIEGPQHLVTHTLGLANFGVGETPIAVTEAEWTSLLTCKTLGGNFMIGAAGKKLLSITEGGEITDISGAKTFTEGKRWTIVQAEPGRRVEVGAKKATEYKGNGVAYLSNGTDEPIVWPGVTKSTVVEAWKAKAEGEFVEVPKAKYLVYHGNRVWAAGIAEKEEAVQWSGEATESAIEYPDPTNWPKANINFYEPGDGHPITALGTVNNYVLVFKNHRTWVIYDLEEGGNRQISDRIGCSANRSVVETHMGTFFLSDDQGVYLTNGSTMKDVSKQVRPLFQGYDTVPVPGTKEERKDRAMDRTQIENCAAEFQEGHYYLTYVALDGSTKTLDYDTLLNSWWLHDLGGNQWAHWQTQKQPALYTIPKGTKKGVVKAFVRGLYKDSGKNYTGKEFEVQEKSEEYAKITLACYWASSWEPFWQYFMRHRFQQPQIKKRIRTLFVDGTGEIESYAYRNFETVPTRLKGAVEKEDLALAKYELKLGESLAHGEKTYQPARYYSVGTARVWSFMYGNKSTEPLEFDTYAADLYFRKA